MIVTLSTLPWRRAHLAVSELRGAGHDVRIHPAPPIEDDPGPVWKWIAPQSIDPAAVVIVLDDDHYYPSGLLAAMRPEPGELVQGFADRLWYVMAGDQAVRREGNSVTDLDRRTGVPQAAGAVGMRGSTFLAIRALLKSQERWREPCARRADDYLVGLAAQDLGFCVHCLPRPRAPAMPESEDPRALYKSAPGHWQRYLDCARLWGTVGLRGDP